MSLSKGFERLKHGQEIAPSLGEHIVVPRRLVAISTPLQHAAVHQRAQAPGEHVGGDAETCLKLIKPRQAEKGVPEDQNAPPLPNAIKGASHGTSHVRKTGAMHDAILT